MQMDESLTLSIALPTIKHLKGDKKTTWFSLQQRFLMIWYSFLGLKPMFSVSPNIQLIFIE